MKNTREEQIILAVLAMVFISVLNFKGFAQKHDAMPLEAQIIKSDYEDRKTKGLLKLGEDYLVKLSFLQKKYTQSGKLDEALAIRKEIERISSEIASLKGEPIPKVSSNATSSEEGGKDMGIFANNEDGVSVGNLKKGDELILQYKRGRWKSHGTLATENPDAPVINNGEANRLGIFYKQRTGSRPRLLTLVPPETGKKPFSFIIPDDYAEIILRINEDTDKKWDSNPGHVIYRVLVKKR